MTAPSEIALPQDSYYLAQLADDPGVLRSLDRQQLAQLAAEIRGFLVTAVSRTGGHLGSNLGVVELTMALHRVFDSPQDVVLWDTGHQAYVHKLLTGRVAAFDSLRQAGGLSGYPNRAESAHDWIENSHASTVLSYAHGFAEAFAYEGARRRVVAVIGDGSMTGGMAFEGLNNIGRSGQHVVIVLNDNGRSYAPTASRLPGRLRSSATTMQERQRRKLERLLGQPSGVGKLATSELRAMYLALGDNPRPAAFFHALGVTYTGPVDGHRVADVEAALRAADALPGPVVVHVVTSKGKGYALAEGDEEKRLHDVSVFDPATGPATGLSGLTRSFSDALVECAAADPRIHAITAAMPGPTGLIPFQQRYPDRYHDVGIAEQHAVTMAAGMAMAGLRPVVAVYSTFLSRAFDQVNLDVGLHGLPVVFALDRAGITGNDGASHHGVLDLALCLRIPGMTVLAPSSAAELRGMLRYALTLPGPAAVRWPKGRPAEPAVPVGAGRSAQLLRCADGRAGEGAGEICLLAVGRMAAPALVAADLLAADGLRVTVWDVRCAKPLDRRMVADAGRHRLVVTVEDGYREGGVGSCLAGELVLLAQATSRAAPATVTLGIPDTYIPHGAPEDILASLGLDGPGVAATTRSRWQALRPAPGAEPEPP